MSSTGSRTANRNGLAKPQQPKLQKVDVSLPLDVLRSATATAKAKGKSLPDYLLGLAKRDVAEAERDRQQVEINDASQQLLEWLDSCPPELKDALKIKGINSEVQIMVNVEGLSYEVWFTLSQGAAFNGISIGAAIGWLLSEARFELIEWGNRGVAMGNDEDKAREAKLLAEAVAARK